METNNYARGRTLTMGLEPADEVVGLPDVAASCLQTDENVDEVHAGNGAANGTRTRDPKIHNLVL